ncbi:MAG: type I pullulanase, partial [Actinobacteria bacterium]|nr:type I pullulanase [Actinomycetota bacterium]
MKRSRYLIIALISISLLSLPTIVQAEQNDKSALYDSPAFTEKYTYTGNDLGASYSKEKTSFRVWAPTAKSVTLLTYSSAQSNSSISYPMKSDLKGTWVAELPGDQDGLVYTYKVDVDGDVNEVIDPYARAATINGKRGVVVDLDSTDPKNWKSEKPKFSGSPTDAVIYELHVRDLSMDSSAPFPKAARGKFTAFNYSNLKGKSGQPVGIAAIKDLGITHIQLLPIYDFASVDESNPDFNWGYDPLNYNVVEGSYSTDPTNPKQRITEFKGAIQSMHDQGIRVIMDVVYNHVYNAATFSQNLIVPGYWFRTDGAGNLTNGSGCGNDVASERPMVSKFIVDSVKYWASEYNLSGFRFDLMGLIDIETMQKVSAELKNIDPSIIVLGEGWSMGTLPNSLKASQSNIEQLPRISVFNDQIRDGVKGSVFNSSEPGWATGSFNRGNDVKAGILGNTYSSPLVRFNFFTATPGQSVNYVEAHDNNTLQDKILLSTGKVPASTISRLHRLAGSIPILAQGLPFIHAGQEFQRSKSGDSNSYQSGDFVNSLKWGLVKTNAITRNYYKGLIALRLSHPAFRQNDAASVKSSLKFLKTNDQVIA